MLVTGVGFHCGLPLTLTRRSEPVLCCLLWELLLCLSASPPPLKAKALQASLSCGSFRILVFFPFLTKISPFWVTALCPCWQLPASTPSPLWCSSIPAILGTCCTAPSSSQCLPSSSLCLAETRWTPGRGAWGQAAALRRCAELQPLGNLLPPLPRAAVGGSQGFGGPRLLLDHGSRAQSQLLQMRSQREQPDNEPRV